MRHESETAVTDGEDANRGGDGEADGSTDDASPRRSEDAGTDASEGDDSGGFLSNVKNARSQLGDARDAFSNARSAGSLPTDEEGRVRIVCRRYEERRLVPLDDKGRPSCFEAGNADCESCVEAVRDRDVETW